MESRCQYSDTRSKPKSKTCICNIWKDKINTSVENGTADLNMMQEYFVYSKSSKCKCDDFKTNIEKLLSVVVPDNYTQMSALMLKVPHFTQFIKCMLDKGVTLNPQLLAGAINSGNKSKMNLLIQHIEPSTHCFNNFTPTPTFNTVLKKMLMWKVDPSKALLDKAVRKRNPEGYHLLCKFGLKPDNDTLDIALKLKEYTMSKDIISRGVVPNSQNFKTLIETKSYTEARYNYYTWRKRTQSRKLSQSDASVRADIIDFFCDNGYKLTYDDVILALKNKYYVNNLDQKGVKLKSGFYTEIIKASYDPYSKLNLDYKPTIQELKYACEHGKFTDIKYLIKVGKLKPDKECLKVCCKKTGNFAAIKLFIDEYGIEPDLECIKMASTSSSNKSIQKMVDKLIQLEQGNQK